jgi:hypothetical protein
VRPSLILKVAMDHEKLGIVLSSRSNVRPAKRISKMPCFFNSACKNPSWAPVSSSAGRIPESNLPDVWVSSIDRANRGFAESAGHRLLFAGIPSQELLLVFSTSSSRSSFEPTTSEPFRSVTHRISAKQFSERLNPEMNISLDSATSSATTALSTVLNQRG